MALYRTKGIVLRSINLSETDKLVTFMTEHYGKVKCVAKAARKIKSRFVGSLEPMSYIYLIYFGKENQQLHRLNHADIIQSFQTVREDFQKLYTGIYMNELVDVMVASIGSSDDHFNLIIGTTVTGYDSRRHQDYCLSRIRRTSRCSLAPEGCRPLSYSTCENMPLRPS